MPNFNTIRYCTKGHIAEVSLARPEKRNAIDARMAAEIVAAMGLAGSCESTHVVVLKGLGKDFCAGADLHWMNSSGHTTDEQPAMLLSKLFETLFRFPKPLVAVVHGSAMGGALGLIAAGDFVYATHEARFAFSEVRLGLVPATISPFVVRRIGETRARQLMLLGDNVNAEEALQAGLVDRIFSGQEIEAETAALCTKLAENAPVAMQTCKQLIRYVAAHELNDDLLAYTSQILEKVRNSDEAREGFLAFKEKRKAVWGRKHTT